MKRNADIGLFAKPSGLDAIATTVVAEKHPVTFAVSNRTVAKADSMGLAVRMCRPPVLGWEIIIGQQGVPVLF